MIENVFYLEDGELVLKPEQYDMQGWAPGEREQYSSILYDCFDCGGTLLGAFEGSELIGAAVLDKKFIGRDKDQLQLKFLHVSRGNRKRGLGRSLFERAVTRARELNAKSLYISATPSENTVTFYQYLGCVVTGEVDEELFQLEPWDIHFVYRIAR